MNKFFTILMTLCIVTLSTFGQTDKSYLDVEYDLGNQNNTSYLEDVSSSEMIPVLKTQNQLIGNNLMENSASNYVVKRGERPPIDLHGAPEDAYEKGIIKIKLDESFTNHLDNTPVIVSDNGSLILVLNLLMN